MGSRRRVVPRFSDQLAVRTTRVVYFRYQETYSRLRNLTDLSFCGVRLTRESFVSSLILAVSQMDQNLLAAWLAPHLREFERMCGVESETPPAVGVALEATSTPPASE